MGLLKAGRVPRPPSGPINNIYGEYVMANMANSSRAEEIENLPPPEGTVYFQPRTRTVR